LKKWLFVPFALILVFALSACSENATVGSSSASDSSASSQASSQASSSSSSAPAQAKAIHKLAQLNFADTSAGQTTKVDSAEIRDVSDMNLSDNNFDDVKYALLVHMSVANKASDAATTYPSQGHVVLADGTQIDGLVGADVNVEDAFKDGDVASGAKLSGYVIFPLKEAQAKKFTQGAFKFDVMAGDAMLTQKKYSVPIHF
jgi:Telomeric repeat-binding factor 2.